MDDADGRDIRLSDDEDEWGFRCLIGSRSHLPFTDMEQAILDSVPSP